MKQNPDFNRRLTLLVMTKCAQHKVSMEKQARIGALLKKLLSQAGEGAKRLGITGARKAAIPAAIGGAGVGGYALGDSAGHSRGFSAGDNAGYGRGLGEGGNTATRNLFKGLIDLQSQGAKSQTDLRSLMPKSGSAQLTWTERRNLNIKLASTILNINAIDREMAKYDVHQLQKSAAVGAHREQRIKYAALIRQRELEKQAFLGGLASLAGKGLMAGGRMLGRGMMGGAKAGLKGAGRAAQGIGSMGAGAVKGGVKGMRNAYAPAASVGEGVGGSLGRVFGAGRMARQANKLGVGMLGRGGQTATGRRFAQGLASQTPGGIRREAMTQMGRTLGDTAKAGILGAGQGMGQAVAKNPLNAGLGIGALGAAAGTQLPGMFQGAQQQAQQAQQNAGGFMNALGQAGQDVVGGFQQAGRRF